MLVDDAAQATGTETSESAGTTTGASETSGSAAPSFDWEAVKAHPEYKTHVKSTLEADEDFRKEATRGVRMTDVEKRAQGRANELAKADRERAERLQTELDGIKAEREREYLSTLTHDEQAVYALQQRAERAEATLAEHQSRANVLEVKQAVDDIIGYAKSTWGLNDEYAEELRDSSDTIDIMDRAMKAVTKQRAAERAELAALKTKNEAQGRVLDGTSTFAATGSSAAGGDLSSDEVRAQYRSIGPSHPNYERIRALYARVREREGY